MSRFYCVLISLVCVGVLCSRGANAQLSDIDENPPVLLNQAPQDSSPRIQNWHDMVTNLPSDWGRFSMLTVNVKTLPAIAGLALVTAGLVASDKDTWVATRRAYSDNRFVHSISDASVAVGDGASHFALAAGFAVYGFAADDQTALRTASQTTEAILATAVVIQLLKHVTGRESPEAASRNNGAWRFFPSFKEYHGNQARYYAYPSGHIATSMATLTVLLENYPEARWLKPVGYATVGLIGVGLVARGYHWYSDLPLGIAIGYAFGKLAANPRSWGDLSEEAAPSFMLSPVATESGAGVGLRVTF